MSCGVVAVSEELEMTEEIEVTEFKVGPEFLRVMLIATDLLEKIAKGEITVSEAQAIFAQEVLPVVEAEREKAVKKKTRRASSSRSRKRSTKKSSKSSSRKKSKSE